MILLLTGCINPNGMPFTALNNKEERQNQYVKALHFYLSQTSYPIVFTENSGTDISILFKEDIESGRMEYKSRKRARERIWRMRNHKICTKAFQAN